MVAIPFALVFLVIAHLMALHEVGSNNPDGVEIKKVKGPDGIPLDGIPFHPYYTVKDMVGLGVFLILFALVVFFAPTMGGYFLENANSTRRTRCRRRRTSRRCGTSRRSTRSCAPSRARRSARR